MPVTHIRTRQLVRASDEELVGIIGAALGGRLIDNGQGSYTAKAWGNLELAGIGALFNSIYGGRRFTDLQSLAACVIDLQIEQIDLMRCGNGED